MEPQDDEILNAQGTDADNGDEGVGEETRTGDDDTQADIESGESLGADPADADDED